MALTRYLPSVSARSLFEPQGVAQPSGWKTHAFIETILAMWDTFDESDLEESTSHRGTKML